MRERWGTILAVCLSTTGGTKYPQGKVMVGPCGFEGDYHEGKPGFTRHISVAGRRGRSEAGRAGENLLIEGCGNLADVPDTAYLSFGDGKDVVFKVMGREMRAGERCVLLCAVVKGVGCEILPGMTACIDPSGEAYNRRVYPLEAERLPEARSKKAAA